MVDLSVPSLGLANPFIVASSPATQGPRAVLKSAQALPGAVVMRNYRHGAGGGGLVSPSADDMLAGRAATQIHALGQTAKDPYASFDEYCQAVTYVRREMPAEVNLWVSVGHFNDTVTGAVDWRADWTMQAQRLQSAGADALELHFNTPGVAVAGDRIHDFYRLVFSATRMVKSVATVPVMVKLPVECCDPLRAIEAAVHGGADAVGPTARWKAFVFDLDWRRSTATPGGGYGGSQALPIVCYTVAEARLQGIGLPMFAGGGVFSWEAAAKLLMAGSNAVQLGSLACHLGPGGVRGVIEGFAAWLRESPYDSVEALRGDALQLFRMPRDVAGERVRRLAAAYRSGEVDTALCNGCGRCVDACWFDAIRLEAGVAAKQTHCIGCGYCFQACPTGALSVDAGSVVASVFAS